MHRISPESIARISSRPAHIRNICILAHVDHGKTSLSDSLISSNGIISSKLAGRTTTGGGEGARYLDSTEEEMARGITMKSSAIALLHSDRPYRELLGGVDDAVSGSSTGSARGPTSTADASTNGADGGSNSSAAGAVSSSSIGNENGGVSASKVGPTLSLPSSSAVSAAHSTAATAASAPPQVPYLINLIDSPGHVDFSSDVATAARLCDGALVLVDAVEGVCIQTIAVIRSAWSEGLKPILILNKIDRLVLELHLTPLEAYVKLCRTIEAVNALVAECYRSTLIATGDEEAKDDAAASTLKRAADAQVAGKDSKATSSLALKESTAVAAVALSSSSSAATPSETGEADMGSSKDKGVYTISNSWSVEVDEGEESENFFDPTKGNVLFASAVDGFAFSALDFARSQCGKLGISAESLCAGMWGEHYWQPKTKEILHDSATIALNKGKPLAVSLMLEKVWNFYSACITAHDEARIMKFVEVYGLVLNKKALADLASKDASTRLTTFMRSWLPLAATVLGAVVSKIPSPREAIKRRITKLWPTEFRTLPPPPSAGLTRGISLNERLARVRAGIEACDTSEEAECVVYVAKMFAVPKASLPPPLPPLAASGSAVPSPASPALDDMPWWGLLPPPPEGSNIDQGANSASSTSSSELEIKKAFTEFLSGIDLRPLHSTLKGGSDAGAGGGSSTAGNESAASSSAATVSGSGGGGSSIAGVGGVLSSESSVETFVAFARVFSGVLRPDKPVFVLGPKYDPNRPNADASAHISYTAAPGVAAGAEATCGLYLMMGRELVSIRSAYAGNVIGLGGLSDHIMKSATLSSTPACPSLRSMTFQTTPLVTVALSPNKPSHLAALERGLSLLNQADPCVEVTVASNGELLLSALGELHLERCLSDLNNRFARVPITASAPIKSFMETITATPLPLTAAALAAAEAAVAVEQYHNSPAGSSGSSSSLAAPAVVALASSSTVISSIAGSHTSGDNATGANSSSISSIFFPMPSSSGGQSSLANSSAAAAAAASTASFSAGSVGAISYYPKGLSLPESGVLFHQPTATIVGVTNDKCCRVTVTASPIPLPIIKALEQVAPTLKRIYAGIEALAADGATGSRAQAHTRDTKKREATAKLQSSLGHVAESLRPVFSTQGKAWASYFDCIWSFGPRSAGCSNLLIGKLQTWSDVGGPAGGIMQATTRVPAAASRTEETPPLDASTLTGNNSSSSSGSSNVNAFSASAAPPLLASSAASAPTDASCASSVTSFSTPLSHDTALSSSLSIWKSLVALVDQDAAGTVPEVGATSSSSDTASNQLSRQVAARTSVEALRAALAQGFDLAASSGPLASEPMWGVAFFIEAISIQQQQVTPPLREKADEPKSSVPSSVIDGITAIAISSDAVEGDVSSSSSLSITSAVSSAASIIPLKSTPTLAVLGTSPSSPPPSSILIFSSGQTIACMRDICRVAFLAGSPRLVEPIYKCELQCSSVGGGGSSSGEQLGKLYGVLARRRGRVVAEDMWEGTQTFVISALLPVAESFGFADDLRKRTSGAATSPQLVFSHWEVMEQDPFFTPSTEEEKEEYGDVLHEGQFKNLAWAYIEAVRTRKGLPVQKKVVKDAERQRNLSRKK